MFRRGRPVRDRAALSARRPGRKEVWESGGACHMEPLVVQGFPRQPGRAGEGRRRLARRRGRHGHCAQLVRRRGPHFRPVRRQAALPQLEEGRVDRFFRGRAVRRTLRGRGERECAGGREDRIRGHGAVDGAQVRSGGQMALWAEGTSALRGDAYRRRHHEESFFSSRLARVRFQGRAGTSSHGARQLPRGDGARGQPV